MALVAGLAVAVLPWCVRNSVLYGHPMGVDDITVHNLIQHNPDDRFVSTEGLDLETEEGRRGYRQRVAKANEGGQLTRRSSEVLARTLLHLVAEPFRATFELARNLRASFSPYPSRHLETMLGARASCGVRLVTDLTNLVNAIVLALAVLGIARSLRRVYVWPVLLWLPFNLVAINLLFSPHLRYIYTISPVLIVFAGAGCVTARRLLDRSIGRWRHGRRPEAHR
jgi:hypothetical protein